HRLALTLAEQEKTLVLPPGSLLGSGGGMKEAYPFTPAEIKQDLAARLALPTGDPVPQRDVYGMAEANWAAMQCAAGNYHVPPWVWAVTVDEAGEIQTGEVTTGLLAFFDPYGGGNLFPSFFRSADQVTLIVGQGDMACPCGEEGAYLAADSIQRVDLVGETGCAAQI
ncbi:MAG: hypothetical protein H5T84_04695, partial [Thermoleophilia bacterium]|nr:hypothetical protein [Thermoleophilia bacterium]